MQFDNITDCLLPIFIMSKEPVITRRETEIFQGFFIQGKYTNISDFYMESGILTIKESYIPESPKYKNSDITANNTLTKSDDSNYEFNNNHNI